VGDILYCWAGVRCILICLRPESIGAACVIRLGLNGAVMVNGAVLDNRGEQFCLGERRSELLLSVRGLSKFSKP